LGGKGESRARDEKEDGEAAVEEGDVTGCCVGAVGWPVQPFLSSPMGMTGVDWGWLGSRER